MQITLELPDEIGLRLSEGRDLARAALEALIAEGRRENLLSEHRAAQIPGVGRYAHDGILKAHGVYCVYSEEDLRRESEECQMLWQKRQAELPGSSETA